ncbi:MAG: restriction endonuclease subunit S [Spirochaetales bacterium]|nr:restriction endonuclease subunit S [Spirochaetales bacterium]
MREMKDSGIEWIGEIPGNWKEERLKYLCSITTGNEDTQNANPEGMYPFYVRSPEIEKCDRFTFDGEGILVAGDGAGAGRVFHYATGKYAIHQRVYLLHDIKLDGRYLHYYVSNIFPSLMNFGSAQSTVPSLRLPMLQNFNVVYPSFHIQKNIASFLDTKCAEIDALSADIQKEIETLQEYRKSVITEAVTKGLDPNVEMKDSGVEWIGEIPVHWNILPFKSQFILSKGLNITKADLVDEGIPVVSYGQIHAKYCDGVHLLERQLRYLPTTRVFPETCIIKKDDIVFADTSEDKEGTGNAVRNSRDDKVFAGYHTIIARPKIITDTRYMSYQFKTLEWRSQLIRYEAVKVYSITQNLLNRTSLIVPPLSVQLLISDYLDSKCAEIDAVISDKQKQLETLAEYRKSLIYEYVTGKKEVPTA